MSDDEPEDVAARRRKEENLRRMATVVKDSNDAITIQDFEGGITAWNRGAELMYGYSEEEALLANIDRLTTPGKVEEQLQALASLPNLYLDFTQGGHDYNSEMVAGDRGVHCGGLYGEVPPERFPVIGGACRWLCMGNIGLHERQTRSKGNTGVREPHENPLHIRRRHIAARTRPGF